MPDQLKAPPLWDLRPGNQLRDPDGSLWVVQGSRKRGRKYLECRVGIRKKGTNIYREVAAKDFLNGWSFVFEDAPDQAISNRPA